MVEKIKKLNNKNRITMAKREDPGWHHYLNGNAIKNGDFSGFKNMPLSFMKGYEESLTKDLEILFLSTPQKIINLINLEVDKNKKDYLARLIGNRLNCSIERTIESTIRILKYGKDKKESILIVSFIFLYLERLNKTYFKNSIDNELSRIESYQKSDFKNVFED